MINFKKIASYAATAAMVGSTVALAAATTFPAPYDDGGTTVVYGSHSAAVLDLAAAVDIQTTLNAATPTTGSTGTPEGADFVKLAKSSNNLNLGNAWTIFTGTVTEDDLPNLLADGTYTANDGDDFDYEQEIKLGSPTLTHFQESRYESAAGLSEKTPTIGFSIASNTFLMNYTLDFTSDAETTISGTDLVDIEGSDLPLFGKNYYVSDFKNSTSTSETLYHGKLTLLDAATVSSVTADQPVTVTVKGVTYDVGIDFIDGSNVRYIVNGKLIPSSGKMTEGQTRKIADDVYIGSRTIDYNSVAGEVGKSTFSIGAGKLEITSGSDVVINDESVSRVKGYVYRSTATSTTEKLDKIVIEWKSKEKKYLSPGLELVLPGFETIKYTMNEFVRPEEEKVTVENDGDDSIAITVPIKDGDATFNLLFAETTSGNFTGLGKATDDRLATSTESLLTFKNTVSGNLYHTGFVASYASTSEAESYYLYATNFEEATSTNGDKNRTDIQRWKDGSWETVCKDRANGDTCKIGDVTLTIGAVVYSSDGNTLTAPITAGADVNFSTIYTTGGLKIYLPWETANTSSASGAINFTSGLMTATGGPGTTLHNENSWLLVMHGEDKEDNIAASTATAFNLTLDNTASTNKPLHISNVNQAGTGGPNGKEVGDSTSIYEAYIPSDDVAPRILHYTKPDEDWAEVYYPMGDSESYADVFLTEADASSGSGSMNVLLVKDSVAESITGRNLVVVGGSCVNSMAAIVLGITYPTCGAGWTTATSAGSGEYVIDTMVNGAKVATLVAGTETDDTANAAAFFTTQDVDTTVGTKYIGTTGTQATMITA